MKKRIIKIILVTLIFSICLLFVIKFAGGPTLKLYIKTGIGDCKKIPILCIVPQETLNNPEIDRDYVNELVTLRFKGLEVGVPRGFCAVKELVRKDYYKRRPTNNDKDPIIYLLVEQPGFFLNIFPEAKKDGIRSDYEFFTRVMNARLEEINNLHDAFFVIIKSIFIPNLGNGNNIKVVSFKSGEKFGFLSYSLGEKGNFFDCNVFTEKGNYFKVYVKDKHSQLSLDKVFAIISTLTAK